MQAAGAVPELWRKDVSEVLIGTEDIANRLTDLAKTLAADYASLNPLLIVVLKGSVMFASDLSRALPFAHELEFIRARSYHGTESTGKVQIVGLENVSLRGRHVVIIEDIVDTGLTLISLYEQFSRAGASSIKCCSFLEKKTTRRQPGVPKIDYVAFRIPDKFVIGYGLDYNQRFRHLPFVGVFKQ